MISVAALFTLILSGCPAFASGPTVIRPEHLGGWTLATNRTATPPYDSGNLNPGSTARYSFTKGPATPPAGTGSLMLVSGKETNSRVAANPPGLTGRTFGSVTELRFDTYLENKSVSGYTMPINLKLAGTSAKLGFQTAVFEPVKQSTAPDLRKWQSWDAGAGRWWASRVTSGACSQGSPCSWKRIVAKLGEGTTISQAYFELGASGDQFSGEKCALDDVAINGVRYDFEQSAPAAPVAEASQGAVAPGGQVTIRAAGFKAHERVAITLHSQSIAVGTATADGSGAVTATITVPAGIDPGNHVILLTGLTSGRTATIPLLVTGGPETGFGGLAPLVATHHPAALGGKSMPGGRKGVRSDAFSSAGHFISVWI